MNNDIELLAKDIFNFTIKYCVYDELMSNYNNEEELYNNILNSLINKTDINEKVLINYLEVGWDFNSQEYKDITSLLYRINELINNADYCDMECPLCEEEHVKHIDYKGTHIYTCEDCSFVGFEFIEDKDFKNLKAYLKMGR